MSRRTLRTAFDSRIAHFLALAVIAIVGFVATPSSGGSMATRVDALPRVSERLPKSVWLPRCNMEIVEWRPTQAFAEETAKSDQAIAVIDETCARTFERYHEFLAAKKLPRLRDRPQTWPSISLLPGNVLLDGKSPRALNDLPSRFEAVAPGCCYWGLYVDALNHLFVRNDPLIRGADGKLQPNPRFIRTLTHEISHILSARLGVWDVVGYDRQRDEELAEEFVSFMGIRYPPESSADDLAFHRGTLPMEPGMATVAALPPPAGGQAEDERAHPSAGKARATTSEQR
ncbi:MAG: hypothetical protein FWD17_02000 [Polyangiaceae bacterium]|nr:hypothetical protein [Polyangiaceae bacterium]